MTAVARSLAKDPPWRHAASTRSRELRGALRLPAVIVARALPLVVCLSAPELRAAEPRPAERFPAETGARLDAPFSLTWSAPPGCPQRDEVLKHIEIMLGQYGSSFRSSLTALGLIEPLGDRFQLTLTLKEDETTGKRVVSSDSCESLGKAAAVVVGLLLRRERELGRQLTDQEVTGVVEDPAKAATSPIDVPATHQQEEPSTAVTTSSNSALRISWLAPIVSVDYRTLPHPGVGFGLGVALASNAWQWMLTGEFWLAQTKTSELPAYNARFRRESIAAWGCYRVRFADFEVAPCATGELDAIQARASGDRLSAHTRWAAVPSAGGGVVATWQLHRNASLLLSGSARAFLFRPEFVVESVTGAETAYHEPFGTLAISIAGAWIF